jgi:hypothetical protein
LDKHVYKFIANELFVDGTSVGKIEGTINVAKITSYIGSGRDSTGAAN